MDPSSRNEMKGNKNVERNIENWGLKAVFTFILLLATTLSLSFMRRSKNWPKISKRKDCPASVLSLRSLFRNLVGIYLYSFYCRFDSACNRILSVKLCEEVHLALFVRKIAALEKKFYFIASRHIRPMREPRNYSCWTNMATIRRCPQYELSPSFNFRSFQSSEYYLMCSQGNLIAWKWLVGEQDQNEGTFFPWKPRSISWYFSFDVSYYIKFLVSDLLLLALFFAHIG